MEGVATIIKQKLESVGFKEISFIPEGKLAGHEFLLSVYFPSTFRTIYFYKEDITSENIIVEFIGMPEVWKGFRIHSTQLDEFIRIFLLPPSFLLSMPEDILKTWVDKRTSSLRGLSGPTAKNFMYFLGYYGLDLYSNLHHAFIHSPFVTSYIFSEAGDEIGFWGAAQYRTWYSASMLNFEAFRISGEGMLYYISGSYLPTEFSISNIIGKTENERVKMLPQDAAFDLAGAFDTIPFTPLRTKDNLLEDILNENNWPLAFEGLYYMSTQTTFKDIFAKVLESPNLDIRNLVAARAILLKDADIAKLAVKKGISKENEENLKANNLI